MFRAEVDITPGRMKGADFQHHQVEGAQAVADLGVLIGESGVAAEEDAVPRAAHDQRRPQRGVAILEAAAAEMLRRRGGDFDRSAGRLAEHAMALPPVELGDALRRHAPGLQVRAHAQAGDEGHVGLGQQADRGMAQMVVVVVRDQHRVHRRHVVQAHRHGLESLGPGQLRWRRALAPHRIGEQPHAVDLQQHRAVAEPGRAQSGVGLLQPVLHRVVRRQRAGRHAARAAAEKVGQRRHLRRRVAQAGPDRRQVAKARALPLRTVLHPFQAQALCATAHRLHATSPGGCDDRLTAWPRSGGTAGPRSRRWWPSCTGPR